MEAFPISGTSSSFILRSTTSRFMGVFFWLIWLKAPFLTVLPSKTIDPQSTLVRNPHQVAIQGIDQLRVLQNPEKCNHQDLLFPITAVSYTHLRAHEPR